MTASSRPRGTDQFVNYRQVVRVHPPGVRQFLTIPHVQQAYALPPPGWHGRGAYASPPPVLYPPVGLQSGLPQVVPMARAPATTLYVAESTSSAASSVQARSLDEATAEFPDAFLKELKKARSLHEVERCISIHWGCVHSRLDENHDLINLWVDISSIIRIIVEEGNQNDSFLKFPSIMNLVRIMAERMTLFCLRTFSETLLNIGHIIDYEVHHNLSSEHAGKKVKKGHLTQAIIDRLPEYIHSMVAGGQKSDDTCLYLGNIFYAVGIFSRLRMLNMVQSASITKEICLYINQRESLGKKETALLLYGFLYVPYCTEDEKSRELTNDFFAKVFECKVGVQDVYDPSDLCTVMKSIVKHISVARLRNFCVDHVKSYMDKLFQQLVVAIDRVSDDDALSVFQSLVKAFREFQFDLSEASPAVAAVLSRMVLVKWEYCPNELIDCMSDLVKVVRFVNTDKGSGFQQALVSILNSIVNDTVKYNRADTYWKVLCDLVYIRKHGVVIDRDKFVLFLGVFLHRARESVVEMILRQDPALMEVLNEAFHREAGEVGNEQFYLAFMSHFGSDGDDVIIKNEHALKCMNAWVKLILDRYLKLRGDVKVVSNLKAQTLCYWLEVLVKTLLANNWGLSPATLDDVLSTGNRFKRMLDEGNLCSGLDIIDSLSKVEHFEPARKNLHVSSMISTTAKDKCQFLHKLSMHIANAIKHNTGKAVLLYGPATLNDYCIRNMFGNDTNAFLSTAFPAPVNVFDFYVADAEQHKLLCGLLVDIPSDLMDLLTVKQNISPVFLGKLRMKCNDIEYYKGDELMFKLSVSSSDEDILIQGDIDVYFRLYWMSKNNFYVNHSDDALMSVRIPDRVSSREIVKRIFESKDWARRDQMLLKFMSGGYCEHKSGVRDRDCSDYMAELLDWPKSA